LRIGPTKPFKSEPAPTRLPEELLPELIRRKRVLLCLDYDGTISEIVRDPATARPVAGVPETLAELAPRRDRITLAIVSGREVAKLREMFSVPSGIALSGLHGLELVDFDGREEIVCGARESANDLEKVRKWLGENAPVGEGFIIEDKRFTLTLHYRNARAPTARHVRDAFAQYIHDHTPKLALRDGKMAAEALPTGASKALAVRAIWQRAGKDFEPVYFGDDLTDEDAFAELGDCGVTVRVGMQQPSAARYCVENPREVARVLRAIASALPVPSPP
jgi:trehalose-phosphatase